MTTITRVACDNEHLRETPATTKRTVTVDKRSRRERRTWEIDLCAPCALAFDGNVESLLTNARALRQSRSHADRREDADIRAWWSKNPVDGHPFRERGRLPNAVIESYHARARRPAA